MGKTFGDRVQERRVALGLSQLSLSKLVGITRQQIALYESNQATPRAQALHGLAKALNTTSVYLRSGYETADFVGPDVQAGKYIIRFPEKDNIRSFIVRGDSLLPWYEEGEVLLIDPDESYSEHRNAKQNLFVVKFMDEEESESIKIVHVTPGGEFILSVPNPKYPPIHVALKDVRIGAKVIGAISF